MNTGIPTISQIGSSPLLAGCTSGPHSQSKKIAVDILQNSTKRKVKGAVAGPSFFGFNAPARSRKSPLNVTTGITNLKKQAPTTFLPDAQGDFKGYSIKDNPRVMEIARLKTCAEKTSDIVNGLFVASDLTGTAKSIEPFVDKSHQQFAGREFGLANAIISVAISILGFASQAFKWKTAEKSSIRGKVGDVSGSSLSTMGLARYCSRMISSTMGLTSAIGAFTGISQLSGRAVQLTGSISSTFSLSCIFMIAIQREDNIHDIRMELKAYGVQGIYKKITDISDEDLQRVVAFADKNTHSSEETARLIKQIQARKIVPDRVIHKLRKNPDALHLAEAFMLAKRDHYSRFIGAKNVQRILKNPAFEFNSKGVSYFQSKGALCAKIERELDLNSTMWKVIKFFSFASISLNIAANILSAGSSELILAIFNLAISVGWTVVDSYFFINDYLQGRYSKDQLIAHVVAQLSILLVSIGATILSPLSSTVVQISLISVAAAALIYNFTREFFFKEKNVNCHVLPEDTKGDGFIDF
ncbi:MAG: hypothetical protein EB053_02530 [Chlamydiae bacterium]|nr:hypothetical protein [Chlamydiota bacterium]